jgi:hypothetical protein
MPELSELKRIAEIEFSGIVKNALIVDYKLRIILREDNGFVEVYLSRKLPDKFGYHWERRDAHGSFYRYDNFPDKSWQNVTTYPRHFHNGSQENVTESPFPAAIHEGFRAFMEFIKDKLEA